MRKTYIITLLAMLLFIVDYHLPRQQSSEIYEKEYTKWARAVSRSGTSGPIELLKTDKHIYSSQDVIYKPPYIKRDLRGEVLQVQKTPILKRRISFDSRYIWFQAPRVFQYFININFCVMLIGLLFFSNGTDKQVVFLAVMLVVTLTFLLMGMYF